MNPIIKMMVQIIVKIFGWIIMFHHPTFHAAHNSGIQLKYLHSDCKKYRCGHCDNYCNSYQNASLHFVPGAPLEIIPGPFAPC